MSFKIYVTGNYFYVVDNTDDKIIVEHKSKVKVSKEFLTSTLYFFHGLETFNNGNKLDITDIEDETGTPYLQAAFETFIQNNTGTGGSTGGGQNISNANLTWTAGTTQDLNNNTLSFINGDIIIDTVNGVGINVTSDSDNAILAHSVSENGTVSSSDLQFGFYAPSTVLGGGGYGGTMPVAGNSSYRGISIYSQAQSRESLYMQGDERLFSRSYTVDAINDSAADYIFKARNSSGFVTHVTIDGLGNTGFGASPLSNSRVNVEHSVNFETAVTITAGTFTGGMIIQSGQRPAIISSASNSYGVQAISGSSNGCLAVSGQNYSYNGTGFLGIYTADTPASSQTPAWNSIYLANSTTGRTTLKVGGDDRVLMSSTIVVSNTASAIDYGFLVKDTTQTSNQFIVNGAGTTFAQELEIGNALATGGSGNLSVYGDFFGYGIPTGNVGVVPGQFYVDTAANALANGDLILIQKQ